MFAGTWWVKEYLGTMPALPINDSLSTSPTSDWERSYSTYLGMSAACHSDLRPYIHVPGRYSIYLAFDVPTQILRSWLGAMLATLNKAPKLALTNRLRRVFISQAYRMQNSVSATVASAATLAVF